MKKKYNKLQTTIDFASLAEEYKKSVVEHIYKKTERMPRINTDGFLSWIGGKKRIAKELISIMPTHETYIELFMGSASVFFAKKKAKYNIINDVNNNLVNLFRVVAGPLFEDFLYHLFHTLHSTVMFRQHQRMLKDKGLQKWHELPEELRAAIYYHLNINYFNNDMQSASFAYNYSDINTTVFQQLIRSREKLQGVLIENKDWLALLQKYNKPNKRVLFFLDPPYVVSDSGVYYEHTFTEKDHRWLATQMKQVDAMGNMFLITYDNVPLIRKLYKDFEQHEISFTYSSMLGNNRKATELVITNFEKNKQMFITDLTNMRNTGNRKC